MSAVSVEPATQAASGLSVRPLQPADVASVAQLHAQELREGLLARLGPGFLSRFYYRRVPAWPSGFCLVADFRGEVAGFVSATSDWQGLFGQVARRYRGELAVVVSTELLRHPGMLPVVGEAWRFLRTAPQLPEDAPGEILSLAVAPAFRTLEFARRTGVRVGAMLGTAALRRLAEMGVGRVRALVRADNTMANILYQHLGFAAHGDIAVFGGRSVLYLRDLAARA